MRYTVGMKIAVIAAQGKSGQAFVHAALNAGHTVRAGVLGKAPFDPHERLEPVQCDAMEAKDVANLIKGCEAVVCLIGHVKGSPHQLQAETMQVIDTCMREAGIKRLVSLTGTGVRIEGDHPSKSDKILNTVLGKIDPDRIADGVAHVQVLRQSSLNWTVVRVLKLTRGKPRKFHLTMHGPAKLLTSRREVAQAILQVLASDDFIHELPIVSR